MVFHDTPTIEIERDQKRRQLMVAIAQLKAKQTTVVNRRVVLQLEQGLERLGGPIE